MYFKIFLECFILTNETKIPLNWFVLGACYNTCLWHSWNLFSTCKKLSDIAFQNLIQEINDDLVVHKKVFRMTQLLEKYKAYLPADTGTFLFTCIFSIAITVVNNFNFTWYKIVHCGYFLQNTRIHL
jgi:hypothetical protein